MTNYVAIRDGGKTNEEGAFRFLRRTSSNGQGPVLQTDMQVTQSATPGASILINTNAGSPAGADLIIAYQNYIYYTWIDSSVTVSIASNTSGNPRIDCIVAYVDLSVVSSTSNNNPGALKFINVQGTPAGSPSAPSSTTIQSSVGAGNPYYVLAQISVANNFTQIVNANVTDKRTRFLTSAATKYLFYAPGVQAVLQDVSIDVPGVTQAQTITTISAYAKTAPVGAGLSMQVYNITQNNVVAAITIAAGAQSASSTTITNASLNAGDILRLDCTSIGSTTAGSSVSVLIY